MKYIITVLTLSTLIACNPSVSTEFLDCNDLSATFKIYNAEEIECEHHYWLTEFENENYIELTAHCDDLIRPFVFNENCVDICEEDPYNPESACGKYLSGRQNIEVLLIEK